MRVNEIFYTLQGEGAHTGTAAVFLRFAGATSHAHLRTLSTKLTRL